MVINKGLVSIIVPVYNVEKYIYRCLKSIYDQSYQNLEVIIVNDGSPDNCENVIKDRCLFDERFKYFKKENGGVSSARNEGLVHASGEYIVFIDSDDWILPNYIQEMIEQFSDDIDILIGKYYLEDTILKKRYIPFEGEHINKTYMGASKIKEIIERHLIAYPGSGFEIMDTTMPVWKNMYRHSLIIDNDLEFVSEREVMPEDYVFNFEAYFKAEIIKVTDVAGYVHEIVENSLSRSYRSNGIEMLINRTAYIYSYINKQNICNEFKYKKENLEKAIVTNFVFSVSLEILNIVGSNTDKKIRKIRNVLELSETKNAFNYKCKYNVQPIFKHSIGIVKTRNPLFIYLAYKLINKLIYFYRVYQLRCRK